MAKVDHGMHCGKECNFSQIDGLSFCSVESGWGGVDCHGELPQLHPWYAQVFDISQPSCICQTLLKVNFDHLFFYRHLGPTHATDPILLHEINKFPDEAKVEFLIWVKWKKYYFKSFCRKLSKNAVDIGISYWGQRWVENPLSNWWNRWCFCHKQCFFLGFSSGWQDCGS